ncbi:hypothetical protein HK107_12475 [Parvularcula sp. ZS-1/3]|uniref:Uncharacterized protein n=1 Tax=Parvularcula mediterranea TaxID=2732508 RepID=A0A7Y3W645_9PROT|nr:hypothetical protein [Parvularcula mediterranea]NNU17138.1 hypothetical protein [Parvularcula mediterranea]
MAEAERDLVDELTDAPAPVETVRATMVADARPAPVRRSGWLPDAEQIWTAAKLLSVLILAVWLIAWPIGTTLALRETTGLWKFGLGYSGAVVILALSNSLLVLLGGYLLRASLRLEETASRLGQAVDHFEPAIKADAVRGDLDLLGGELDRALVKLAKAEKQIRDQVGAIDAAAETMRGGTKEGTERLAKERQALIDATAKMNAEADAFATALAARSRKAEEDASSAFPDIEEKLKRLEVVSAQSADQFASLREAMVETNQLFREAPKGLADDLKGGADTLRTAQQALIDESEKLRLLIEQQKTRADSLGRSLAEQSEKLKTRPAEPAPAPAAAPAPAPAAKKNGSAKNLGGSWRRILEKVENDSAAQPRPQAQPRTPPRPVPELPAAKTPEEQERVLRMQRFTMAMKAQLFGMPSADEQQRFERGERQLFVGQILANDPVDLRAKLRTTIGKDESFAEASETYLADFDQLLAPVVGDDAASSEVALQDMLRTPLGQLYVAIGTAKGHFD